MRQWFQAPQTISIKKRILFQILETNICIFLILLFFSALTFELGMSVVTWFTGCHIIEQRSFAYQCSEQFTI